MTTLPIARMWYPLGGIAEPAAPAPRIDPRGIRWLAGLRVVLAVAVLAPMVTLAAGRGEMMRALWAIALLALPVVTSAIGLATATRASSRVVAPQLAVDVAIVLALVWLTGGVSSLFAPVLLLPVLASTALCGRRMGLQVAAVMVLGQGCIMALQYGPAAAHAPAWLGAPLGFGLPSLRLGMATFGIQALGVVSVAMLVGHLSASLDRTSADLERAHLDLADLTSLSQRVIDSMAGGVVAADATGRVVLFNRTAAAITGLAAEMVLGRRLVDVLQLPAGWQVGLSQGLPSRFEFRFDRGQQQALDLGATVAPLVNDAGEVAGELVTFQDLTLIKQREREQQRQARLAAVGEMAAGIAHEIRNPLASMTGSIQLLQRELSLRDDQAVLLDIVLRESQRLNQTIKDFLTYAGPQRVSRATVDVRPLVRETVELLTRGGTVGSRHQVIADLPELPVHHHIDEAHVRQVLWNLATNALKAMPDGGQVTLCVRHQTAAGRREPTLVLTVEDEGVGMDSEAVERMFQPFHGAFRQGSGLGMSIVHRIVTDHGGDVRVASQPGHGTRVEVRIPWIVAGEPGAGHPGTRPVLASASGAA